MINIKSSIEEIVKGWNNFKILVEKVNESEGQYIFKNPAETEKMILEYTLGNKFMGIGERAYGILHLEKTKTFYLFMQKYTQEHPEFLKEGPTANLGKNLKTSPTFYQYVNKRHAQKRR